MMALDPPPWLAQMRRLGYPPGYLVAQADESPRLAIYEDEGGATTILLATEEDAASLLPSPSPPAAAVDGSEIEEGEMEVSMDLESSEEDGQDGEAAAASTLAPTMVVAYPGINSPIPDGADPRAWGLSSQSNDPGETASRRGMSMSWAAGLTSSLAKHQVCTATEGLDALQLGLMPKDLSMCEAAGTSVTHMSAPKLTGLLPSAHVLARYCGTRGNFQLPRATVVSHTRGLCSCRVLHLHMLMHMIEATLAERPSLGGVFCDSFYMTDLILRPLLCIGRRKLQANRQVD
eukprot:SM000379S14408  [mRNA]  locus=s379:9934:11170:+ [translate_table: standard]